MNSPRVLVSIAAYNAEKNIKHLLEALLGQKEAGFSFDVLVFSDNSTDKTVEISNSFSNPKLQVVDNHDRGGFAGAVKQIINKGRSYDATLILNDDIYIYDLDFLSKLFAPLISNDNAGLITGNPTPTKPENFIEKAAVSSFNIYNKLRYTYRDGNNRWTCDGKVMLLTNKFIGAMQLPADNNEMGNVDAYLYFACLELGFEYLHARDAVVYYRMPSTYAEYLKWDSRNKSNEFLMAKRFGKLVSDEYHIPTSTLVHYSFLELLRNPIGVAFLFLLRFYSKIKARRIAKSFNSKWDVITTTKESNS